MRDSLLGSLPLVGFSGYVVMAAIVGLVALALLGGAGWYFYSTVKSNAEVLDKLHEKEAALEDPNEGLLVGLQSFDKVAGLSELCCQFEWPARIRRFPLVVRP